jgi:DNA-binding NtrC family response regulator
MDDTHVLVVDDEEIVCDRLKNHLEKDGFRVETFTDSRRALAALEDERYDVIVTDFKMAGATGLDVLHNVRNRGYPAQVIIITGYASMEAAREAEAVGAFDFLCKPFELKTLSKLVKRAAKSAKRRIGRPAEASDEP